jgi:hypothetical protein
MCMLLGEVSSSLVITKQDRDGDMAWPGQLAPSQGSGNAEKGQTALLGLPVGQGPSEVAGAT